ncbi:MAG: hypothetical protein RIC55_20190 [Pirellulaceae bacterium]
MTTAYADSENPYEPPEVETHADRSPGRTIDFGAVMRRWENLRHIYNGLLTVLVLSVTIAAAPQAFLNPMFWVAVLFGAVIANLCFMIGPAIDAYLLWFRKGHIAISAFMFLAGTLIACWLAICFLMDAFPILERIGK